MTTRILLLSLSFLVGMGCIGGDPGTGTQDPEKTMLDGDGLGSNDHESNAQGVDPGSMTPFQKDVLYVPGRLPSPAHISIRYSLPRNMRKAPIHVSAMPCPRIENAPPARKGGPGASPLVPVFKTFAPSALKANRFLPDEMAEGLVQEESPLSDEPGLADLVCCINGADDRTVVSNTSVYPYSAVVRFKTRWGQLWLWCSGTIIRPNWVLTAGHCIYSQDRGWVEEIQVVPGQNGAQEPFGSTYADYWVSVTGWTQNHDLKYDIGLIRMANAMGNTTGTFGYGVYSNSSLSGSWLFSAGYPQDFGGETMIEEYNSIYDFHSEQLCTNLDVCGGQSGSGVGRYNTNIVAAVHSACGGTCGGRAIEMRLTQDKFDFMQDQFSNPLTQCSCSGGPCCDGCSYKTGDQICNYNSGNEYRCDGTGCGSNAQQRQAIQHCSGSSASCDGPIEWQPWQEIQSCGSDQLCTTDGATYAACNTSSSCSTQVYCDCDSGPCCDGCHFLPDSTVCNSFMDAEYRCAGDFCGASTQIRGSDQYCSGWSSGCEGQILWHDWEDIGFCSLDQICQTDGFSYAVCATCAEGCSDGACINGTITDPPPQQGPNQKSSFDRFEGGCSTAGHSSSRSEPILLVLLFMLFGYAARRR